MVLGQILPNGIEDFVLNGLVFVKARVYSFEPNIYFVKARINLIEFSVDNLETLINHIETHINTIEFSSQEGVEIVQLIVVHPVSIISGRRSNFEMKACFVKMNLMIEADRR